MKRLSLFSSALLMAALAAANPPFQDITHQFWASQTAFAGYSSWYAFLPKTAVPVKCNPAGSRCTAAGYAFQGGQNARFASQGQPPAGLYTIWGGSEALYSVCDVKGASFDLRENDCSGSVVTFTTAGT